MVTAISLWLLAGSSLAVAQMAKDKFYTISLTRELNTKYFGWHVSLLSLCASYSTPLLRKVSLGSSRPGTCPTVLSIMKFTPELRDSFDNVTRCIGSVMLVAVQFPAPWSMIGRGQGTWNFLKITCNTVDNVISRVLLYETKFTAMTNQQEQKQAQRKEKGKREHETKLYHFCFSSQ